MTVVDEGLIIIGDDGGRRGGGGGGGGAATTTVVIVNVGSGGVNTAIADVAKVIAFSFSSSFCFFGDGMDIVAGADRAVVVSELVIGIRSLIIVMGVIVVVVAGVAVRDGMSFNGPGMGKRRPIPFSVIGRR